MSAWVSQGVLKGGTGATGPAGPVGATGTAGNAAIKNLLLNGNFELVPFHWFKTLGINNWVADMWYFGGSASITGTVQFAKYGPALGANPQSGTTKQLTTQTTQATLATTDYASLLTWVEGETYAVGAGASMTIAGQINPGVAGTYSISVRNGAKTQSFIFALTITSGQVGTWVSFSFTLPAPSSASGFSYTNGTIGLIIGVSLGAGSTFITATTGSWVSGNFTATTGQVNLLNSTTAWSLAEVALYPGTTVPSTYLYAPPHDSAKLCQRYFGYSPGRQQNIIGLASDITNAIGVTGFWYGPFFAFTYNAALTYAMAVGQFEVEMWAIPAITVFTNSASGNVRLSTGTTTVFGCSAEGASVNPRSIGRIITTNTFASGQMYQFHYFADARPAIA